MSLTSLDSAPGLGDVDSESKKNSEASDVIISSDDVIINASDKDSEVHVAPEDARTLKLLKKSSFDLLSNADVALVIPGTPKKVIRKKKKEKTPESELSDSYQFLSLPYHRVFYYHSRYQSSGSNSIPGSYYSLITPYHYHHILITKSYLHHSVTTLGTNVQVEIPSLALITVLSLPYHSLITSLSLSRPSPLPGIHRDLNQHVHRNGKTEPRRICLGSAMHPNRCPCGADPRVGQDDDARDPTGN